MNGKSVFGMGLFISSAFVVACSVGTEPVPQPTETADPQAIASACYHCSVTCTNSNTSPGTVTDYTSCGVLSVWAAQQDAPDACTSQFGAGFFVAAGTSVTCAYAGPSPAPAPSAPAQQ